METKESNFSPKEVNLCLLKTFFEILFIRFHPSLFHRCQIINTIPSANILLSQAFNSVKSSHYQGGNVAKTP